MTLAALMVEDVSRVFLNTDEHAETVAFTPEGGTSRSIDAIMFDMGGNRLVESPHVKAERQLMAVVAKSDTTGIDAVKRGDVLTWGQCRWGNPEYAGSAADMQAVRFTRIDIEAVGRGRPGRL